MNAIIMAAGMSSRFVPISLEKPKGLLEVKGEVLIERQIRQLKEAGVEDITVVTGYKARAFEYLREIIAHGALAEKHLAQRTAIMPHGMPRVPQGSIASRWAATIISRT